MILKILNCNKINFLKNLEIFLNNRKLFQQNKSTSVKKIIKNVIIPLCKPGIIIGSIFVITVVMGDFLTIGIMGGQQLASIGKIINTEMNYLQLPGAAANSVILLFITIFIIIVMTKFIDIRKEL